MLTAACSSSSPSAASSHSAAATASGVGSWIGLPFHAASAHHSATKTAKLRSTTPVRRSHAAPSPRRAGAAFAAGRVALIGALIS